MQTSLTELETSPKVSSNRSTALEFSSMLCNALEKSPPRLDHDYLFINHILLTIGCTLQEVCKNEGCLYSQLSQEWGGEQFGKTSKANINTAQTPIAGPLTGEDDEDPEASGGDGEDQRNQDQGFAPAAQPLPPAAAPASAARPPPQEVGGFQPAAPAPAATPG